MSKKSPKHHAVKAPWVRLSEVVSEYGMTMESAGNAIREERFPVRTYRVGRLRVVDRAVHAAYLAQQKEFYEQERKAGLVALKKAEGSRA